MWGDANDAFFRPRVWSVSDQAKLRRNVGLGGVTFHASQKISVSGEVEGASSGGVYFRTSLYNYQKVRAQAQLSGLRRRSASSADFTLLNNQNPMPGVNYDYRSHQESLSLFWSPRGRQDRGTSRAPTRAPRCARTSAISIREL